MHEYRRLLDDTIRAALARVGARDLPAAVAEVTVRHEDRLHTLVGHMDAAGLDRTAIRAGIREVLRSYEDQLVDALEKDKERSEA